MEYKTQGRTVSKFDEHKERILELRSLGFSYKKISNIIQVGTAPSARNFLGKLGRIE